MDDDDEENKVSKDILGIQDRIAEKMKEIAERSALCKVEARDPTNDELSANAEALTVVRGLELQQEQMAEVQAIVKRQMNPGVEPVETGDRVIKPDVSRGANVVIGQPNLIKDPDWGFRSFGHFCHDVAQEKRGGGRSEAMTRAATTFGTEAVGTDGGYAVPPAMSSTILAELEDEDSLLARASTDIIATNSMTYPKDEATPWGTTGIISEWEGEGGTHTERKPSLKTSTINANKLVSMVKVTDELLEDASALNSYVSRKAASAIRFKTDLALNQGDGVGSPLGFRDAPGTIAVARTDTNVAELEVRSMWVRLYGPWRKNAVWLANQDVETHLMVMQGLVKNDAGTENVGGYPIYLPQGGYSASPFATLFGRPVIYTQTCDAVTNKGDICLVDMTQYRAVQKGGMRADSSIHLHFDQDITTFKFVMRVGGQPMWESAISPRSGSVTLSGFVVLAA